MLLRSIKSAIAVQWSYLAAMLRSPSVRAAIHALTICARVWQELEKGLTVMLHDYTIEDEAEAAPAATSSQAPEPAKSSKASGTSSKPRAAKRTRAATKGVHDATEWTQCPPSALCLGKTCMATRHQRHFNQLHIPELLGVLTQAGH